MEKFCLASIMSWFQLVLVFFHLGTHILGLNFLAKNLYWKLLSWLVHSIGIKPPWKLSVWEKVVLETVSCKIPSWNKGSTAGLTLPSWCPDSTGWISLLRSTLHCCRCILALSTTPPRWPTVSAKMWVAMKMIIEDPSFHNTWRVWHNTHMIICFS